MPNAILAALLTESRHEAALAVERAYMAGRFGPVTRETRVVLPDLADAEETIRVYGEDAGRSGAWMSTEHVLVPLLDLERRGLASAEDLAQMARVDALRERLRGV